MVSYIFLNDKMIELPPGGFLNCRGEGKKEQESDCSENENPAIE